MEKTEFIKEFIYWSKQYDYVIENMDRCPDGTS